MRICRKFTRTYSSYGTGEEKAAVDFFKKGKKYNLIPQYDSKGGYYKVAILGGYDGEVLP